MSFGASVSTSTVPGGFVRSSISVRASGSVGYFMFSLAGRRNGWSGPNAEDTSNPANSPF